MDPVSFSLAVVGMFHTCRRGYNILSDAKNAPSDAQDAARRVRIEGSMLAGWGEHFEIRENSHRQQAGEKLKFHLTSSFTRSGVFEALRAIAETFTDIRALNKKYGIVFDYHAQGNRVSFLPGSKCSLRMPLTLDRVFVYLEILKLSSRDGIGLEVQTRRQ